MTVGDCQGFCMTRAFSYNSLFTGTLAGCAKQLLAEQQPLLLSPPDQLPIPATLSVEILKLGAPVFP